MPEGEATESGAVELLRDLLRFDTSNPPGAERECQEFLAGVLEGAGVATRLVAKDPERPNLLARVRGRGEAPPLLLYGHVDVVPAVATEWAYPPFDGELAEGAIWGRGALDMKAGVALIIAVAAELAGGEAPPGDVLVALTADEEAGSHAGMRFLAERPPSEWKGVRHAISEVGGMTMWVGGQRVTPVQIAEKQRCVIRVTVTGSGGHAAAAVRGTAAGELGRFLAALDARPLHYRLTPVARQVLLALAEALGGEHAERLRRLAEEWANVGTELRELGELGRTLEPLMRDTATATGVGGGIAGNVVPTELYADLDGRVLPGGSPEHLVEQLEELAPGSARFEILHREPAIEAEADHALLPLLAEAVREHEPEAPLVPWMLAGYTDARYLSRLGIQTYGFLPLRLPPEITPALMHAADERVPAAAIEPGVECLLGAVRRYRG